MAKKTISQKERNTTPHVEVEENEQLSESYISIGLGLLVVVVVGVLLWNYLSQKNQPSSDSTENITQEATSAARPGATYIVAEGDTLWSISEKSFGSGYNWTLIAEANNLSGETTLEAGQQLKIPEAPIASTTAQASAEVENTPAPVATLAPTPDASPMAIASVVATPAPAASIAPEATSAPVAISITGTSYTIVHGDTLWDIACRAYGDCYQWPKIAQANNLENPNLIHADNVLTLPR